jgi:hypothetical protein
MTRLTTLKAATAAFVLAAPFAAEPARADAGFKVLAGVEAQPMTGAEMEATQGQGFVWDARTQRIQWNYNGKPLAGTQWQNWYGVQDIGGQRGDVTAYYYWTGQYLWSQLTGNWFDLSGNVWNPSGQLVETRETVRVAYERWAADNAGRCCSFVEDYLNAQY